MNVIGERMCFCFFFVERLFLHCLNYKIKVIVWEKKSSQVGRRDSEKILDSQIKHYKHSSQNLMDEFHEHWSLHVAEFVYNHLSVFSLFTELFSAMYTLVSSYTTSTQTAWGAPECILSLFEVLYSIVNLRLSDPLTMVLHFYPYPTSLTFDPVHENPAPSCSSSRSIEKFSSHLWKSSVSWLWISFYRPWSSLYL